MRKIYLLLILVLTLSYAGAKTITINKVSKVPIIDGSLESLWDMQASQRVDQIKGETEGFQADFKMCYDSTYLYIAVMVTDPTPNIVGPSTWSSDCVELFFAMDTANANAYRPGDWQIRKLSAKTKEDGGLDGSANLTDEVKNYIHITQLDGVTYIQEWAIPWISLVKSEYEDVAFDGKNFRFDLQAAQANESVQGRIGQALWNASTDDQWNTIRNQGFVVLKEKLDGYGTPEPTSNIDIVINKVSTPPVIDGSFSDYIWDYQNSYTCNQTRGTGGEGFYSNFKMCYDNTNLYIAVSITDPTPNVEGPSSWNSDCLDLYFAMDTNTSYSYRPGDWLIRKMASKTQENGGLDGIGNLTDEAKASINVKQMDGYTYTQEWSIPWKTLKETSNFDGKNFRFDMQAGQANDSELGKVFQAFWHSNADDQWSAILHHGYIQLAEKIVEQEEPKPNQPDIIIERTTTPPVIDGSLDALWSTKVSNACNQTKGEDIYGYSSEFKMCYDDVNLYIAVMVNDPTPNVEVEGNTWRSDCVELFLAMDTANSIAYRSGDWQFRKIAARSQEDGGVDGSANLTDDVKYKIKVAQIDGSVYVQEWQIPWDVLKESSNFNGEYFRFDMQAGQANDPFEGRIYQAFWHSNADNQWSTIQDQGLIKLRTKIGSIIVDPCEETLSELRYTINQLQKANLALQDTIALLKQQVSIININIPNSDVEIKLYPIPVEDYLNISSNEFITSYEVYNINNIVVQSGIINSPDFRIFLGSFKSGEYIVKLYTEKGVGVSKIIIKK